MDKLMSKFKLVKPEKKYEQEAIAYLAECDEADGGKFNGVGGLDRYRGDYSEWLKKLEADSRQVPNDERVPAETYFLVEEVPKVVQDEIGVKERIVGLINIRLVLNDSLWNYGGHIGYSIRPSERKKGYAKLQLYLALKVCQNRGIKLALLDCDRANLGSAKTMQALGGKLIRQHQMNSIIVQ